MTPKMCSQHGCGGYATHFYRWPGHDGVLFCCREHFQRVVDISSTMGMPIVPELWADAFVTHYPGRRSP